MLLKSGVKNLLTLVNITSQAEYVAASVRHFRQKALEQQEKHDLGKQRVQYAKDMAKVRTTFKILWFLFLFSGIEKSCLLNKAHDVNCTM